MGAPGPIPAAALMARGGVPPPMGFRSKDHPRVRRTWNSKCSKCGTQTQVPFDPATGQVVMCRNCRAMYLP